MFRRKLRRNRLLGPASIACVFIGGGAALAQPSLPILPNLPEPRIS